MRIELFRTTSNNLYTQGTLLVNGSHFSDTVEHTRSMLPIGEYRVKLQRVTDGPRKMVIIPASPLNDGFSDNHTISHGNSWKNALTHSCIVIGKHLIPGAVSMSPKFCNRLIGRMKKTKTPVTLSILAPDCKKDHPSAFWSRTPNTL